MECVCILHSISVIKYKKKISTIVRLSSYLHQHSCNSSSLQQSQHFHIDTVIMKAFLIVATLFTLMVSIGALSPEEPSEVADILRKLGLPNIKNTIKQDLDDVLADEDDAMATVMTNALLSSLLEGGEDGRDSIIAGIMKSNDEEAEAQFRFIRRLFNRFRTSPIGKFVGQRLRQRYCNSGK